MFLGMNRAGLIAAMVVLFGAASARAEFAVNAFVTVTPSVATVQVFNSFEGPVSCYGSVAAVTSSGFVLYQNFELQSVDMQTYGYAYVYTTNPYDPFVNGTAQAWCELVTSDN
jgi:hypothetical protein